MHNKGISCITFVIWLLYRDPPFRVLKVMLRLTLQIVELFNLVLTDTLNFWLKKVTLHLQFSFHQIIYFAINNIKSM